MSNDILVVENVSFSYSRNSPVFEKINLSVGNGKLIGLLGENGAGKTTLFNLIKGGNSKFTGNIQRNFRSDELISLPQVVNLSGTLKNYEIFDLICCFNKLTTSEAKKKLDIRWSDDFFYRYENIKNKRTYAVSYGEKRWLTISLMLGLCDRAKFFMLDEPTVGIDIQYRMLLWELIDRIVSEGRTVLFSTHLFDELTRKNIPFSMLSKHGIFHYDDMKKFIASNLAETPEEAFLKVIMSERKTNERQC